MADTDELAIELVVDDAKAIVKLEGFQQKVKLVSDDINKVGGDSIFAGKYTQDLDALSKRAETTRQKFAEITKVRLDGGQIGNLTQEIVRTGERARQLQSDIAGIRRELANPNRKTSIAFLTDELKAAEREADQLNRKLSSLPSKSGNGGGQRGGGRRGRITDLQATALELTDDFAPEGLNRPFNAAARGLISINALSLSTVATFGAIAAAGVGIVKITESIREQAEKRLKVEEMIAGVVNRQIISQREGLQNLQKLRAEATVDRQFNRDLPVLSVDELKNRRASLEKQQSLTPATLPVIENGKVVSKTNESFEKNAKELLALDAQIELTRINNKKKADDAFDQRFESQKRSQESAMEAENRRAVLQKRNNEIEQARAKKLFELKDDFRDSLVSARSTENPLVKQMADLETVTERAQKKFGAFGDSVVNKIADIEKANLTKAIGLQNFENNFEALKLRQQAQKLAATPDRQLADFQRNLEKVNQTADFSGTINDLDRKIKEADFYASRYNPNNPKSFAESNRRSFNDDVSDVGVQIREAVENIKNLQTVGLEGTGIYGQGAIADKILSAIPSRDELLKRLDSPSANARGEADFLLRQQAGALLSKKQFEQQKFQDFLEDQKSLQFGKEFAYEQINLINNDRNLTDAQKATRRLSVTDALGNDLDPRLKQQRYQDYVSSGKEKENQGREAIQIAKETKDLVAQLLNQLAKAGIKIDASTLPASKVDVRLIDERDGGKSALKKIPTAADIQKASDNAYKGGTFFEQAGY